jgi:hypothetical protein
VSQRRAKLGFGKLTRRKTEAKQAPIDVGSLQISAKAFAQGRHSIRRRLPLRIVNRHRHRQACAQRGANQSVVRRGFLAGKHQRLQAETHGNTRRRVLRTATQNIDLKPFSRHGFDQALHGCVLSEPAIRTRYRRRCWT